MFCIYPFGVIYCIKLFFTGASDTNIYFHKFTQRLNDLFFSAARRVLFALNDECCQTSETASVRLQQTPINSTGGVT
jgi:hypothetical protein